MQTEEFFDLIMPSTGKRVVAYVQNGEVHQAWGDTNEWMTKVVALAVRQGVDVYHACSTYISREGRRKQANVEAVKSFWLDLDCGPGKPYPRQSDAAAAVLRFALAVGLPQPFLVDSGYGIHAYWPLTEAVDPEAWRSTATLLKQASALAELESDPSRTSDSASILRPPGSTNFKRGGEKVVRLAMAGQVADYNDIDEALSAYIVSKGVAPQLTKVTNINSDLTGGREFPPSYADPIAEGCGIMGMFRETRGYIDQPTWYHGLGVLAHCVDGEIRAHEWSEGHPNYTPEETQKQFERAKDYGPTTCKKLGEQHSAICAVCPFKITSPITLGRVEPSSPLYVSPEPDQFGAGEPQLIQLPDPYRWRDTPTGKMIYYVEKKEGGADRVSICNSLFYPVARIGTVDQQFSLEIEMHVKDGETRRFNLDTALVGGGGAPLYSELSRHEIVAQPGRSTHLQFYLQKWVDKLRQEAEETRSYAHFGWHDDSFLVGNRMITKAGVKRAVLEGFAKVRAPSFNPTGSFEVWRDTIDTAYNYEGQEAFQFMVALAFASPLYSMFGGMLGGITAYAHSEGSGVGKTTAERAALSAWGNWSDLQLSDGKVTTNYLWAHLGTMHNIPVVLDELTNQDNKAASQATFDIASGRAKERLDTAGNPRTNNANWSTIVIASGNNLLSEKLELARANNEAERLRLFEFSVRSQSRLTPNDAQELFPKLIDNYGHAGPMFMEYVVNNRDAVQAALQGVHRSFNLTIDAKQNERYWTALAAAVLTATRICKKLGILHFDMQNLTAWIVSQVDINRSSSETSTADPLEQVGGMLTDLWQGILVTEGEGDMTRQMEAAVVGHPKGQLVGRAIIPVAQQGSSRTNERHVLLVSQGAVKEWCNKKGVSAREMFEACVSAGWVEPDTRRYQLGKGTKVYANISGHVRCWVLDPRAMGVDVGPVAQILRVVASGVDPGVIPGIK